MVDKKTKMIRALMVVLMVVLVGEVIWGAWYLNKPQKKVEAEVVPIQETSEESGAMLFFGAEKTSLNLGKEYEVRVMVETLGKQITGADAVIKFDPIYFTVKKIVTGKIFPEYPVAKIDKTKGLVEITGTIVAPDQMPFRGTGELATIIVQPLKAGESELAFDFISGMTNDSNLVERGTGEDILGKTETIQFRIVP